VVNLKLVLQLKKATNEIKRHIEELIILDAQRQPHTIYKKRITEVK
jgi:hypothetical protein